MIRAANNGISAVIDANGRILASLGLNVRGVIDAAVPPARAAPPYAAWGDWLFLLNAMFFLIGAWLSSRNLEQRQ
jgi:apolipoprotein N-acyltransferase